MPSYLWLSHWCASGVGHTASISSIEEEVQQNHSRMTTKAVEVSLIELSNGLQLELLETAFGPESLGIIIIKDLPQEYHVLRLKVLKSMSLLANLPELELKKLESPESLWLTGWSCGKEFLKSTGGPDTNKGSFYVNCAFHKDAALEGPELALVDEFENFKTYTTPNIWPPQDAEGLECFQENVKKLVNMIINVAEKVAENCDRYIEGSHSNYPKGFLKRVVRDSTCSKARLLHYFPMSKGGDSDDWCGEHLDHSCITGLTSALFLDESKGLTHALDKSPDPNAGLYIRNRNNQVHKVNIPTDCLAFQTGSALQEISRNNFKAVPHYVQGTFIPNIARNTLAVFCQPDLDEPVNDEENFAQFAERIVKSNH